MEMQGAMPALFPVILKVPDTIRAWRGRRHVMALSRLARSAARQSARRSGGVLGRLQKSSEGVPLPSNGWYWSVAHKPAYVAGVTGRRPLGIDIEPLRPRSRNLFSKIADQQEWQLGGEDEWHLFYRFWTAKEAVLKAVGVGMRGLSNCRVVSIDSTDTLTLAYQDTLWEIQQRILNGHLVAITTNGLTVHWG